jgi:hypothetical protein
MAPVFAWLKGLDEGVTCVVEVLPGVLILRVIAATDVAAGPTHAQVDPRIALRDTICASLANRRDLFDIVQMCAFFHFSHHQVGCGNGVKATIYLL